MIARRQRPRADRKRPIVCPSPLSSIRLWTRQHRSPARSTLFPTPRISQSRISLRSFCNFPRNFESSCLPLNSQTIAHRFRLFHGKLGERYLDIVDGAAPSDPQLASSCYSKSLSAVCFNVCAFNISLCNQVPIVSSSECSSRKTSPLIRRSIFIVDLNPRKLQFDVTVLRELREGFRDSLLHLRPR